MKKILLSIVMMIVAMPLLAQSYSKDLEKKAKKGDIASQLAVGDAYFRGDGVDIDKAKAAKWYYKAVEGKCDEAKERLYKFYSKELEQLAKKGDTQALFELGKDYYEGDGVEKNANKAAKYLKNAMKNGHKDAAKLFYSFDSDERRNSELKFKMKGGFVFSGYSDAESPFVMYLGSDTIKGILKSPVAILEDAYRTCQTFSFYAAVDYKILSEGKLFMISDKAAQISGVVYKTDNYYGYKKDEFLSINSASIPTVKMYILGNEVEMESFHASLTQSGDGTPLGFRRLEYTSQKILYTSTDMQMFDPNGYLESIPAEIKENMKVRVWESGNVEEEYQISNDGTTELTKVGEVEYQSQFEFSNGGILELTKEGYSYCDSNYQIKVGTEKLWNATERRWEKAISLKELKKTFRDNNELTYGYRKIKFPDGGYIGHIGYYGDYMPLFKGQKEADEDNAFKSLLNLIGSDDKNKFTQFFLPPMATKEDETKLANAVISENFESLSDYLYYKMFGRLEKNGEEQDLYLVGGCVITWERIKELDKKIKEEKGKIALAKNKKYFNKLAAKYGSTYVSALYDYKSGAYKLDLKKGIPFALMNEIYFLKFHASYSGNVSIYFLYQHKTFYKLWFTNGKLTDWYQGNINVD